MEFPVLATIAAVAFVVVVLLVIIYLSIRVVQQYEKMVVFRLGKTNESMVRDPGLRFLVPVIDRPVKVDVREQFIEVPSQTTITKDNAPINVDFLIYWRISDPLKSVVNVVNFPGALQGVATTTLRAVIGDILLDEVLSKREQINEVLRVKLDEVTERWGGKVTTVEIREITPPRDVQDAMNRQLTAERTRRAVVTESEGSRQAAINVAEGQKQAEILKAEGDRQAAILRAEGFSEALTRIFHAATDVDQKTMSLQYLETLKALGAGPATKFVIPFEFTRLLEPFLDYVKPTTGTEGGGPRSIGTATPASTAPTPPPTPPAGGSGRARCRPAGDPLRCSRPASPPACPQPRSGSRRDGPLIGCSTRPARRRARRPWARRSTSSAGRSSGCGPATASGWRRAGCRPRCRPSVADAVRTGRPIRTRRSCCCTATPARSRPTCVEYGPFLRRTAGVLGLDFRGHGGSDDGPTTFGLLETEDIAGALAWLGERGITRVAMVGTSMGGITAIAVGGGPRGRLARGRGRRSGRAARRGPRPSAPRRRDRRRFGRARAGGPGRDPGARSGRTVRGGPPVRWRDARPRRRSARHGAIARDRPARVAPAPAHPRRRGHDRADRGRPPAGARSPDRRPSTGSSRAPTTAPATRSPARTTSGG